MAVQKEVPICIFKPSRCDVASAGRYLSAHLEGVGLNGLGRNLRAHEVPSSDLVLAAWALLLRYYLSTDLIAFASSGVEHDTATAADSHTKSCNTAHEKASFQGLIHSLEVTEHDTVSDVLGRLQEPAARRHFDPALLPYINTLLVYRSCRTVSGHGKATGIDNVAGRIAHQIDICLTVIENRNELSFDIRFSASKFSEPLPQRVLKTYCHILALISTQSRTQTIRSLDPLTRDDLDEIREWNTHRPKRMNTCLHEVFEQQVQSRFHAPAVCSWDGNLTYGELNALATKLAHHLSRLQVGREVFVPYGFEKSMYAVVASLAVLKAGGAFVPIDFSHPRDRLKSIVSRVGAKLILASAKTAPAFEGLVPNVLVVDGLLLDNLPEEGRDPLSAVGPSNSAFILFTSGSTGEPKGLIQEHGSVCTVNEAYRESLFINEESRVLNFATYTFDVSTVDVFTTLSVGGCVCIPSEEDRLTNIVRVINEFRVNWIDLTPSFAMASISRPAEVPTLKTLVLAGEEVKREHVAHFVGRIDRVINCYGPAEAGGCLANVYQSAVSQPQTIGLALSNASCWIVDLKNPSRLAPIGAIGELVIEGSTLARGYLKDPTKTNAAFSNQLSWRPGEPRVSSLYRTGDIVQYRPDGLVNFIGRRDTQVKVRGQKIELTEIEQHLSHDTSIKRCLIDFPQSGVYAQRLVAIIEPHFRHQGEQQHTASPLSLLSAEILRESRFSLDRSTEALARRVPAYMMPAVWLIVTGFPVTDSKKVDRRKVRDWLTDPSALNNLLASANTSRFPSISSDDTLALRISHKVSEIIANGNSQVLAALTGRDFDLTAAGVDSIQIVTISKWIQDEYGLKLSIGRLTRPDLTIIELAQVIASFQDGQEPDKLQPIEVDIRREVGLLSQSFSGLRSNDAKLSTATPQTSNVFLTGGTGFLGNEILHQLLCDQNINKVFVHVRATSAEHGRQRVLAAAKRANWWSASFDHRLEVWTGDLGSIKLALSDKQWAQVTGEILTDTPIDTIIHNGATVRWDLGYDNLRASNTISTLQLLEAVAKWRFRGRFVYVSGGQALSVAVDDEDSMADQGVNLTGYSQTKIVSELLVKRFARSRRGRGHMIRVVKPSYIISDAQQGVANSSDYLWRLTKSVVELGTYSHSGRNGWLFVSDVVTVANAVCQICKTKRTTPTVVKILDGLVMQDFWNILTREFGYRLRAMDGCEWWYLLRSHVEQTGPRHCLWPLQHVLDPDKGEIASITTVPTAEMILKSRSIRQAVRSNIQNLRDDQHFLPQAPPLQAKL